MVRVIYLGILIAASSASAQFSSFAMNRPLHYFVLTNNATSGAISGNPNSFCQNDINSFAWKGKPSYSIPSNRVRAFVCDMTTCATLDANETYIFAHSGDSLAGGATFTTDASGVGPNDSANWSSPNYFNAAVTWWSGRQAGAATQFSTSPHSNTCSGWGSIGSNGVTGATNATNALRWSNASLSCLGAYALICIVDL